MRKERYLLVRAPYDKRVASLEPLGLEYIMAAIKAEDAFCMIHDESISSPCFRFKRLLKVVDENKITIVGFSIISNIAHYVLKELHKLKKSTSSSIKSSGLMKTSAPPTIILSSGRAFFNL